MAETMRIRGLGGDRGLRLDLRVPGDKSISHRAALLALIAQGESVITNYAPGEDCKTTLVCAEKLGATVDVNDSRVRITGVGPRLKEPEDVLNCGNSGTTMRLLSGILAGQDFLSVLSGDKSLRTRPMRRIVDPLRRMGAHLDGRMRGQVAPLVIRGGNLVGTVSDPIQTASAQVKSCALLAGLFANGTTEVLETSRSRDHTERMLPLFGATLERSGNLVRIKGPQTLSASDVRIPGDFSSAAFWLGLGALVPNSVVKLNDVGVNPLRAGFLEVMRDMGADIRVQPKEGLFEPQADVLLRHRDLCPAEIGAELIPSLLDEIPMLAVIASRAHGSTRISGAEDLRNKESDRIALVVKNLRAMGACARETQDGMVIHGQSALKGAPIQTGGDHRIAMAFAVAALCASGETVIDDVGCIDVSYPGFLGIIERISAKGCVSDDQ